MKIPIKMHEEVLKILETQGNIMVIPKYPNYQKINSSVIKYYSFPDTVYLWDEEENKFYLTDERVFYKVNWEEWYNDLIKSSHYLKKRCDNFEGEVFNLKMQLKKLPNFIKWLFNIKL
jgi:hypothetical protein